MSNTKSIIIIAALFMLITLGVAIHAVNETSQIAETADQALRIANMSLNGDNVDEPIPATEVTLGGSTNFDSLGTYNIKAGRIHLTSSTSDMGAPTERVIITNRFSHRIYIPQREVMITTTITGGAQSATSASVTTGTAGLNARTFVNNSSHNPALYAATSSGPTDFTPLPSLGTIPGTTTLFMPGFSLFNGGPATTTNGAWLATVAPYNGTSSSDIAYNALVATTDRYGTTTIGDGTARQALLPYLAIEPDQSAHFVLRNRYGYLNCGSSGGSRETNSWLNAGSGVLRPCEAATSSQLNFKWDLYIGYISDLPGKSPATSDIFR